MTKHIYAAWWGGPNFRPPQVTSFQAIGRPDLEPTDTDVETFSSLLEAVDHFEMRLRNTSGLYPGVTDEAEMLIWLSDPRRDPDPYPDRRLRVDPQGGVRVERC